MSCEQYDASLSEYIDGTLQASQEPLDVTRLDALEAHLAACPRCRAVVDDLQALRAAAGSLEPRVPPPHVWTRIAGEIERRQRPWWAALLPAEAGSHKLSLPAEAGSHGPSVWAPAAVTSAFRRKALAAAAAVVIVLGGASWFAWQQMNDAAPASVIAEPVDRPEPDPALVQDVETQLKLAEEHYVKAIAGLEAIASAEGSELDQETSDVLQANLTVIDGAIGESRAALQTDPGSALAQQSLFEALRSKVTLLQDTIALINEMRKGNQEGAARIVNGLNP